MRDHQIAFVPSVSAEPFGLVALEATASGCAVIASEIVAGSLRSAAMPPYWWIRSRDRAWTGSAAFSRTGTIVQQSRSRARQHAETRTWSNAADTLLGVIRQVSHVRLAITSLYLPGSSKIGVGYQVHAFANEMTGRGHDVTVFSPDDPGEAPRYAHRKVDPGHSLRTFRFAWRLRGEDLDGFDILHAHGDDCFLAGVRRPPHIRTVHGSCIAEARRIPGAKAKLRMGVLGVGEIASSAFVADRSFGVSSSTKRIYPWLDGVIPNGVSVEPTMPGARKPLPPRSCSSVPITNRKRGRLLMETFASVVRPQIPEAACRWCARTHHRLPASKSSVESPIGD